VKSRHTNTVEEGIIKGISEGRYFLSQEEISTFNRVGFTVLGGSFFFLRCGLRIVE